MKATLEFDLDQPEERKMHLRCAKVMDILLALHDIQERFKNYIKNNEGVSDPDGVLCAIFWRDALLDDLNRRGVDLDELLS